MPRDHARVNVALWTDPDFRRLPLVAQGLYLALWTSPGLSYCGVHDWRPGRLGALSAGSTSESIETIAACLEARHFIVVDRDTEEVLVRSWARFDGLMKQPRMAISFVTAYAEVASESLRSVLVHEARRIQVESPELRCWTDRRVQELLDHPAVSAKSHPAVADPFRGDLGDGFTPGLAQTPGGVSTGVSTPPTPAPAPTPTPCSPQRGHLDDASQPSSADADGDFEVFWTSYPRKVARADALKAYRKATKKTDPDAIAAGLARYLPHWAKSEAKFIPHASTWLNQERWADEIGEPGDRQRAPARISVDEDFEQPPSGLSAEEWAEWDHDRRQRAAARREQLGRERGAT